MNILIAAVSHPSTMSGVQRHAVNLAKALLSSEAIHRIHVVAGAWQHEIWSDLDSCGDGRLEIDIANTDRAALARNLWHYCELPRLAAIVRADVLHLTYPVPIPAANCLCPTVLSLHDLYPFEIPSNFGFPKVFANRVILSQCLRAVDRIACVSESTQVSLTRYFPDDVSRKSVSIPNCIDCDPAAQRVAPSHPIAHAPFLLCVAQHRRNKNLGFLLELFSTLLRGRDMDPRMQLIIVGISGPETPALERAITGLRLGEHVRLLDYLSEANLRNCYSQCQALLAPSITEGFGLPVVEALSVGARVICSDIPAFREFAGNSCRLVPLDGPSPIEQFADTVLRSLRDPKPSPLEFPHLSTQAVGSAYVHLYRALQHERHAATQIQACPVTPNASPERQSS